MVVAKKKTPAIEEVYQSTVRIPRSTAAALKAACAERSLDRTEPHSQNAIILVALNQWLRANGYMPRR